MWNNGVSTGYRQGNLSVIRVWSQVQEVNILKILGLFFKITCNYGINTTLVICRFSAKSVLKSMAGT